jgi:hypothetical protein
LPVLFAQRHNLVSRPGVLVNIVRSRLRAVLALAVAGLATLAGGAGQTGPGAVTGPELIAPGRLTDMAPAAEAD